MNKRKYFSIFVWNIVFMICFPNAKINLGLNITGKRSDGYHNIESVFFPAPLYDALEITECKNNRKDKLKLYLYGISVPGESKSNLCVKAYQLLEKEYSLPPVDIHLYKKIPVGAGLGGGSSDGAQALHLLNNKFGLKLTTNQLQDYASTLGSDCPFFIYNKPMLAMGRGDELEEIQLDLSAYRVEIKFSGLHISTQEAYSEIKPEIPAVPVQELVRLPISEWKDKLKNDFEKIVFKKYPEVKRVKQEMYEKGALYAAMTGSGSAVYAIFGK